jgi:hypothetical protein
MRWDGLLRNFERSQMGVGIKHFVALPATYPTFGNPKLIRHDFEHRGTCRALGN